jgi:excisionase family DNA binding protein
MSYGTHNGRIKPAVGGSAADPVLLFDNRSVGSLPSLLTIAEVARLLKISAPGVRRLQQGRHISFIKVGGSVRFDTSDVLAYLEQQRVRPIG